VFPLTALEGVLRPDIPAYEKVGFRRVMSRGGTFVVFPFGFVGSRRLRGQLDWTIAIARRLGCFACG
jgi:hypothetical protein